MLLVTGSIAFDHIMIFPGEFQDHIMPDKLHMLNISFLVPEMRKSFGGVAGNIAYSLGLLQTPSSIFAIVGPDFSTYKVVLDSTGVDTSLIEVVNDRYTSTAFCVTDKKYNQIWGFYPGADELTDRLSVKKLQKEHPIDFAIVAPHNPKAMMKFVKEYYELRIPFLFDPGMQLRWLDGDQLQSAFVGAKIIIGNDYEVGIMEKSTGINDLHSLTRKDKIIITTLGDQGSKVSVGDATYTIPAAKISGVLDPSGAGDAYRSGFMAGYMRGMDIEICARMGSVAAAYCVEQYGTTSHRYTIEEFTKRYKLNYKDNLAL